MNGDKTIDLIGSSTCLIHSGEDHRFETLKIRLAGLGSTTVTDTGRVFLEGTAESCAPSAWLFVIDLDEFPDKGAIVDVLLEFRRRRPDAIICLVSDKFSYVDIGTERLSVCDGSVPKSMMSLNIVRLIRALCDNNLIWQSRVYERKRETNEGTVTEIDGGPA